MAEHGLHVAERSPVFKQMCGESVSQKVRAQRLCQPGYPALLLHDPVHSFAAQAAACLAHE
jgi:hypothetical protein